MNKIYLALIISLLSNFGCTNRSNESKIKVQVKVVDRLNPDEYKGTKGTFYSAHLDIINNTDSVVRFWVMSCSWQENWIFDTDNISLFYQGCDSNFPVIKQIKQGEKLTIKGIIQVLDTLKVTKQRVGILGFVLIKEHDISSASDFRRVLSDKIDKRKDIIWSANFSINK